MSSSKEEYITESSEHYYMQVVPETIKLELRKRYSAKGRHYHTWNHIKEMFRGLELIDEALECLPAVVLAIIFHDSVFDPKRGDSEARSIGLMRRLCKNVGHQYWIERADTLIAATTEHHSLPQGWDRNGDAGYFLDLDLAILGAGAERYQEYLQQVRKEYRHLSAQEWRTGRRSFVQAALAKAEAGVLFHTDWGRANFQPAAVINLRQELAALEADSE